MYVVEPVPWPWESWFQLVGKWRKTWHWKLQSSFFRRCSRNSSPTAMYDYIEEGLPNQMELFVVHDGNSLLINQQLVERCLALLRLFDKLCSDEKWKTITKVVEFMKIFKTATRVLSGFKNPTISLGLLFRAEIVVALKDLPNTAQQTSTTHN